MSQSSEFKRRKSEILNVSYRKDGDALYKKGKYKEALVNYKEALKQFPIDIKALVSRSKCHIKLKNIRKALADVDIALHLDNLNKEALLQKANILFKRDNYEMAQVFYSRGQKHYPKTREFQEGVDKAEKAIQKGRKSRGRRTKLTQAGDLTFFIHKVPRSKPFTYEKPKSRTSHKSPSATFSSRPLCQLIRIHKTPAVALTPDPIVPAISADESEDSLLEYDDKRPESSQFKETLGHLYSDKKYLEKLIHHKQLSETSGAIESPVQNVAGDGLSFLYGRASFWNRLGPLPPPHPIRKSRASRYGGSTVSLDSVGSYRTYDSKSTYRSSDSVISPKRNKAIKSRYAFGKRKKDQKPKVDPSKLDFKFPSLGNELGGRMMTEILEEEERSFINETTDNTTTEEDEKPEDTAGESVSAYVQRELDDIYHDFTRTKYKLVNEKCESCLKLLDRYSEEQVPHKYELIANLYSYLGNSAMQTGRLELAKKHHETDLIIGNELDLDIVKYRALGNLGRLYMIMEKYNKALEMFTMKAPMCKTPKNSSMLFHEIGNCFLMLNNFTSARDSGKKSLQTAVEANDRRLQLQACVLVGIAEVNMKTYEDAHNAFEAALDLAKVLGDERAQEAMKQALIDINKKITSKLKKEKPQKAPEVIVSTEDTRPLKSILVKT